MGRLLAVFAGLFYLSGVALALPISDAPKRVGVVFGSFDPVHDGHTSIARWAKKAYNLDEIIFVPTSQKPVHGKTHLFTEDERAKMLAREIADIPGAHVDTSEQHSEGRANYSFETLNRIEEKQPEGTELYIIGGEDLFKDVSQRPWKGAERILTRYHWVVAETPGKGGDGKLDIDGEKWLPCYEKDDERHFHNRDTHRVVELVHIPDLPRTNSRDLRARYAGVRAIFHEIEAPSSEVSPAEKNNLARLGRLVHRNDLIKSTVLGEGAEKDGTDLESVADKILDPRVETVLGKGDTGAVFSRLGKKPVFLFGSVAGDSGKEAVDRFLAEGRPVYVVTDAITGSSPQEMIAQFEAWQKRGARLVTTDRVEATIKANFCSLALDGI